MAEGQNPPVALILANVPVKVPSPQHFSDIGCTEDMYWAFRADVEMMTQQIVQKYLIQLLDAATDGAGMVAEPVIKAAVNVDKALNNFVKLQEEHALRDQQRDGDNDASGNRIRSNKRKRKRNRRSKAKRQGHV